MMIIFIEQELTVQSTARLIPKMILMSLYPDIRSKRRAKLYNKNL